MARVSTEESNIQAPWAAACPKKGKKLVKVSNNPNTWVEMPVDATEEQIKARIEKYNKDTKTLKDLVAEGYFKDLNKRRVTAGYTYPGYTGPIYSIPRFNPHMVK